MFRVLGYTGSSPQGFQGLGCFFCSAFRRCSGREIGILTTGVWSAFSLAAHGAESGCCPRSSIKRLGLTIVQGSRAYWDIRVFAFFQKQVQVPLPPSTLDGKHKAKVLKIPRKIAQNA